MRIVSAEAQIISNITEQHALAMTERAGRVAYKSEDRITPESALAFVNGIISSGHLSVLEHVHITVKLIIDRGIVQELTRHRIGAYTNESTRYCNYTKGKFDEQVTVIQPTFDTQRIGTKIDAVQVTWENAMHAAEKYYTTLIELGCTPQEARSVLPLCLKSEIIATYNIRQWFHILEKRTAPDCHPDMRFAAFLVFIELEKEYPNIFTRGRIPAENFTKLPRAVHSILFGANTPAPVPPSEPLASPEAPFTGTNTAT